MPSISLTPIGVVRSPYATPGGMPIQTVAAQGVVGRVELEQAYAPGLKDLADFSHLWLLVYLHQMRSPALEVTPFLDSQPRGVFATRSPRRPNPLGLSLVRLLRIEEATLHIEELDLLDGTPVLDIKPYVPLFDNRTDAQIGWFTENAQRVFSVQADDRFR